MDALGGSAGSDILEVSPDAGAAACDGTRGVPEISGFPEVPEVPEELGISAM
ncbi:hypothetical protein [Mycobacterium sp. MAA66]|uniref:hypothetical protein n=1 Tax=Mycobacterium sp. MAA66 TaxID=3156297 RepID=UPI003519B582